MNLQTFTASTMNECLLQVKRTMGSDAVIVHTRTDAKRFWLGLRKREFVEITAGKALGGRIRASSAPKAITAHPMKDNVSQFKNVVIAAGRGALVDQAQPSRAMLSTTAIVKRPGEEL